MNRLPQHSDSRERKDTEAYTVRMLRLFVLIILFFEDFSAAVPYSASAPTGAAPSAAPTDTDFIRTSCETTLYPDLCYHSLAGYAKAVEQNPARLARIAVGVSLASARRMAFYVANLTQQADYGTDSRAASALRDCLSLFGDAVDQISGSLKQMRRLTGAGEELRFQISNVQTWMSAALTNEDTCTDGFEDVADGPLKVHVCDRTAQVKEMTSNALALVNRFMAKVIVP